MADTAFETVHPSSPLHADPNVTAVRTPGGLLLAMAGISLVVCLAGFALKQVDVGVAAASIALLASGAALSCLTTESRRLRDTQRRRNFGRRAAR